MSISFEDPILLQEEILGIFQDKEVIFNHNTQLYLLEDSMIAYFDDEGDIRRNENYVPPILLEMVWEHYEALAFKAKA